LYRRIAEPNVERLSREWDELARGDALWEVLSDPDRSDGRWQLARPERHGRALDFGCGVGRLTRALSANFDRCVGIDVSTEMVEQARKLNADRENLEFVVNVAPDLADFDSGSFDLVYSSKVLQHMPGERQACAYVAEFLRLLRPGGIAIFQLWTHIPFRNRIHVRRAAPPGTRGGAPDPVGAQPARARHRRAGGSHSTPGRGSRLASRPGRAGWRVGPSLLRRRAKRGVTP
jgi:SAM-dependent methyltransferase